MPTTLYAATDLEKATFAGGCFWCMESAFDDLPGVISAKSGYMGDSADSAQYNTVSAGKTKHRESVQVVFDPKLITYEKLLDIFWHNIDPLQPDGQFCDLGYQYTSAIFTNSDSQKQAAIKSKQKINSIFEKPIITEIVPAGEFYPAEDYHQDYHKTHPVRYKMYRAGCGRDRRLKELWTKKD